MHFKERDKVPTPRPDTYAKRLMIDAVKVSTASIAFPHNPTK